MKKTITYKELLDDYLGNIVIANELYDYLIKDNYDNFIVRNGDIYRYYNQFGNEISAENWEECEYYGLEGDREEKLFFQYYLIDYNTYHMLCDISDEVVIEFPDCNVAFWAVDHYGSSWSQVRLSIDL